MGNILGHLQCKTYIDSLGCQVKQLYAQSRSGHYKCNLNHLKYIHFNINQGE